MSNSSIKIDRLALEGDGVGRLTEAGAQNGQVAFVSYSLPGERINAHCVSDGKSLSRWLPIAVEESSAARVKPPCPYHFTPGHKGPWCGGCNWQQLEIKQQRVAKRQLVVETLERIGGFKDIPVGDTLSAGTEWRYRNKVQVPFGQRSGQVVAGFFAPGSHEIVEFNDCLVQPELSVQIVNAVKAYARKAQWAPYNEDSHRGWLRHLLVRTNEAGQAMMAIVTFDAAFKDKHAFIGHMRSACPQLVGISQNVQRSRTNVILGRQWIHVWGHDRLDEAVSGLLLSYSISSFFQVNSAASEALYNEAIRVLSPDQDTVVLDLYCGVGALTLLAARRARFALGVELAESSIRDAQLNARRNQIGNAKFVQASAERVMARGVGGGMLPMNGTEKLFVMVDPPRTGCDAKVLEGILRLKPKRIVYVSCNPATLARDLKVLAPFYHVRSVTPVDLFPQTSHIESVTLLDQKK